MKKISAIFAILAISILFAQGSYAAMDDKSDQLSNNQSSVFSPGYINASKQKTDSIIYQQSKPKTFMENAMDYVKNKLGKDVAEDAVDKPELELKKKTGGSGENLQVKSESTSTQIGSLVDADIIERLTNEAMNNGASMVVLKDGKTVQAWTEMDYRNGNNHSYFSISDSLGNKLITKQELNTEAGYDFDSLSGITDLGNGRFAVVVTGAKDYQRDNYWGSVSPYDYVQSIRIYNENGGVDGHTEYYTQNKTQYDNIDIGDIVSLGNDLIAMTISRATGKNGIYKSSSSLVVTNTSFTNTARTDLDSSGFFSSACNSGQRFRSLVSLGNGKMAVTISELYGSLTSPLSSQYTSLKILDKDLNILAEKSFSAPASYGPGDGTALSGTRILNLSSLGDGKLAVTMNIADVSIEADFNTSTFVLERGTSELAIKIYDSGLNELSSYSLPESWSDGWSVSRIGKTVEHVTVLDNGNIVIPVIYDTANYFTMPTISMGTRPATLWVLDSKGNLISNDIMTDGGLSNIISLGGGDFATLLERDSPMWGEGGDGLITMGGNWGVTNASQQYSTTSSAIGTRGTLSTGSASNGTLDAAQVFNQNNMQKSPYSDLRELGGVTLPSGLVISKPNDDMNAVSSIFKMLLKDKNGLNSEMAAIPGGGSSGEGYIRDSLERYALAIPAVNNAEDRGRILDAVLTLNKILSDPTDSQKLLIDVAQGIIQNENQSDSPELKKASDDLLQMVAAVLIAQAMPDLLKEGDATMLKSTFLALNSEKMRIISEYQQLIKPYYSEVKKLLSKNIALLQLNNILSKAMIAEELNKLEPSEIDKIFDKLRKASNRSFEEEYILQQEAKYRKAYIEPNKRVLEEKMKTMMKEFTQRLSGILEGTKK